MEEVKSQEVKIGLIKSKDLTYVAFFLLSLPFGVWLCLLSSGSKLATDILTMWIVEIICTFLAVDWLQRKADTTYSAIVMVPIGFRFVGNLYLMRLEMFSEWSKILVSLNYALQIIGIWIIVACAEESYRATLTNLAKVLSKIKFFSRFFESETAQDIFAVTFWIVPHFIQHPFNWLYLTWLIVTGFCLQFALRKGGLGSSTLAHFVINLTA